MTNKLLLMDLDLINWRLKDVSHDIDEYLGTNFTRGKEPSIFLQQYRIENPKC